MTSSVDRLMAEAEQATSLSDWGDLPFREGLEVLLWSMAHESGKAPEQRTAFENRVRNLLVKRLRLVGDRRANPEIADERIVAPLVVVGLPRSGSTHLHALLAQCVGARAPLQWEMSLPSPPPDAATHDADPRITQVEHDLAAMAGRDSLLRIHPYGARRPEQCIGLLDWSFVNSAFLAHGRIPSYYEWFLGADHHVAYEHHRRTLQHLQWRAPGRWVLKWPKHVFSLDALLATYPDARLVWTHRDPVQVLPSATNFVGTLRRHNGAFDPVRFGAEWVAFEEMGLRRGLQSRDWFVRDDQVVDVYFDDLMADPVGTVASILTHFGDELDAMSADRVRAFLADNPRGKHGRHMYTPEDYGLTEAGLRQRFAFYSTRFVRPGDAWDEA